MIIRVLAAALLVATSTVWALRPAAACTCATPDPRLELENADVALVGRVISRSAHGGPSSDPLAGYVFTFEPETVVKGDIDDRVVEFNSPYGSQCGIGLGAPDGERVGIFLRLNYQSNYEAYACSSVDPDVLASLVLHDETASITSSQPPPDDVVIAGDAALASDFPARSSESLAPVTEESRSGQAIAMWSAASIAGLSALLIGYAALRTLILRRQEHIDR